MRAFCPFSVATGAQVRFHVSYGIAPLTCRQLASRYRNVGKVHDGLELLERVEEHIFNWKLNKWEMRVPPLLPAHEKEVVRRQQDLLKGIVFERKKCRDALNADFELVSSLTGISKEGVREKSRAWLQEETARLRWMGEVNKAVQLRDAFLRLEVYGSRDHMLLERLCCMYGLALQGSFDDAFSNYIVEDPVTKKISVDERNPFSELISYIVTVYPQIDIIYDFLGFNLTNGYRLSLRRYLEGVQSRSTSESTSTGRLLLGKGERRELLFDNCDSRESMVSGDYSQGLPDFLYLNGTNITLITIASDNPWLRNRQLPHRRQLEGIARRASLVLGIPFSEVRVRNLLLPPTYLDKSSIARINEVVLGLSTEEQHTLVPWLTMYHRELDTQDVDFCSLMKSTNEDEWITL